MLDVIHAAGGIAGIEAGALQRGNDALRYAVGKDFAARISDGNHGAADHQIIGRADGYRNQLIRIRIIDLQDRDIDGRIGAYQRSGCLFAAGQEQLIAVAGFHYMIVSQYIAAFADANAAAFGIQGFLHFAAGTIPFLRIGQNAHDAVCILLRHIDRRTGIGCGRGRRLRGFCNRRGLIGNQTARRECAERKQAYERDAQYAQQSAIR